MVSSSLKIDTEIRFYICNIGTLYPKVNSALKFKVSVPYKILFIGIFQ